MDIIVVGINHKTSSLDFREKFYLNTTQQELLLSQLRNDPKVTQAFVISTCNRTEIYAQVLDQDPNCLLKALFAVAHMDYQQEYLEHFYCYQEESAIRHVLGVTSGLDSLIIGEKQILGQMKDALMFSTQLGMMGKEFNILANVILETGRKVRRETAIDYGGSSISWAAVNAAASVFGHLKDKSVLVLGSGKMGRLALDQLVHKGIGSLYIMNRTLEKAQELANHYTAQAVGFWELKETLTTVDVCICSASCTHYLIGHELVDVVMQERQSRPLVCVDISVPRNIDPRVGAIEGVTLMAVDDLSKVVMANTDKRLQAVSLVKAIIEEKLVELAQILEKRKKYALNQFDLVVNNID